MHHRKAQDRMPGKAVALAGARNSEFYNPFAIYLAVDKSLIETLDCFRLPRPSQMAELLDKLTTTQDRMRPYLDRYRTLMQNDPAPVTGAGANSVEENQRIIDGASESLHFMSHACHALSDIIVDMGQQPPRNLRCRPIIIQQSAIWQAGTPIQVEAQISFQGRNSNNSSTSSSTANSSNAEGAESTTTPTSTPRSQESAATSAETPSAPASSTTAEQQSQGSSNASSSQPQNDQPQAPQQQPRRQTQVSVGEFWWVL